MAECLNLEANREKCACSNKSCERHGLCCACIAAHREAGGLPSCVRHLAKKSD
jgi:hypothetical protein